MHAHALIRTYICVTYMYMDRYTIIHAHILNYDPVLATGHYMFQLYQKVLVFLVANSLNVLMNYIN